MYILYIQKHPLNISNGSSVVITLTQASCSVSPLDISFAFSKPRLLTKVFQLTRGATTITLANLVVSHSSGKKPSLVPLPRSLQDSLQNSFDGKSACYFALLAKRYFTRFLPSCNKVAQEFRQDCLISVLLFEFKYRLLVLQKKGSDESLTEICISRYNNIPQVSDCSVSTDKPHMYIFFSYY